MTREFLFSISGEGSPLTTDDFKLALVFDTRQDKVKGEARVAKKIAAGSFDGDDLIEFFQTGVTLVAVRVVEGDTGILDHLDGTPLVKVGEELFDYDQAVARTEHPMVNWDTTPGTISAVEERILDTDTQDILVISYSL